MIVIHEELDSCEKEFETTKYIVTSTEDEDKQYGKVEVSWIDKGDKYVIVMPSQTNCSMGCKFCHLTGTNRPVKNLSAPFMLDVIEKMIRYHGGVPESKDILVSFMGAGEPLLNIDNIIKVVDAFKNAKGFRFGLATIIPTTKSIRDFTKIVKEKELSIKVHLSLHGFISRKELLPNTIYVGDAIELMDEYAYETGNPIEFHYALVDGVNDTWEEIIRLHNSKVFGHTIKFLTLNPVDEWKTSPRSREIKQFFTRTKHIVEWYTPPGRDVGSSCGQFNTDLYNI